MKKFYTILIIKINLIIIYISHQKVYHSNKSRPVHFIMWPMKIQ